MSSSVTTKATTTAVGNDPRAFALSRSWRLLVVSRARLVGRRLDVEVARGIGRLLGMGTIAIGGFALILTLSVAAGFYVRTRGEPQLIAAGIGLLALFLLLGSIVSSLSHAAASFFTASDLWLWDSSPAPRWLFFADRTLETGIHAVPAALLLGVTATCGFLVGADASVAALLRAILALPALIVAPVLIGVLLAHVGGALLPAGKLRRVAFAVVGIASTILLIIVRQLRLERALTEQGAADIMAQLRGASDVGPSFAPHQAVSFFIVHGSFESLVKFTVFMVVTIVISYASHRALYARARHLASNDAPTGLRPDGPAHTALIQFAAVMPQRWRSLWIKDILQLVRDPAQWAQVLLLSGVVVLYVLNLATLRDGFKVSFGGFIGLPVLHTGMVCLIAAGMCARFAFGQLSQEGPAFWLVEGAPMRNRDLLLAKAANAGILSMGLPIAMGVVGDLMLNMHPISNLVTLLLIVAYCWCATLLSVARGALAPTFDAATASQRAMGPHALSTTAELFMWSAAAGLAAGVGGAMFTSPHVEPTLLRISVGIGTMACVVALWFWRTRSALRSAEAALLDRRISGPAPAEARASVGIDEGTAELS